RLLRRADPDAVVVVAVLRRSGPDSPVLLVRVEPGQELSEATLELALQGPSVEVDAKAVERVLDLLEHPRNRVARARRELVDVRAAIAGLGRLFPTPPRLDRGPELLHLRAGVVVVVLPLHPVAGELEQPCDRVAIRAVARRGDGDRARRVRGDHLDLNPLALRGFAGAEVAAPGDDLAERRCEPGIGQP